MNAPPSRRPWWKKKRTWAAVVTLLLIVAYPASVGPVLYCHGRGWLQPAYVNFAYDPLLRAVGEGAANRLLFDRYGSWWQKLAKRHKTASG